MKSDFDLPLLKFAAMHLLPLERNSEINPDNYYCVSAMGSTYKTIVQL